MNDRMNFCCSKNKYEYNIHEENSEGNKKPNMHICTEEFCRGGHCSFLGVQLSHVWIFSNVYNLTLTVQTQTLLKPLIEISE